MREKMLPSITNLLKVKSLVTMITTGVFSYLAIRGTVSGQEFLTVFSVIIAFYFGTQAQKIADGKDEGAIT